MNCKFCGAEVQTEEKFCSYCGKILNENGKVYETDAFAVTQIFSVSNRTIVIGNALQHISVGDYLFKGEKSFKVYSIQQGKNIVSTAEPNNGQVGLVFLNFNKKDIVAGDKLIFKKEN